MKKLMLLSTIALAAGSLLAADAGPKDDVITAAKKLTEQGNYSWKATMDLGANSQFTPGPTLGKTDKDGTIWLSVSFNDQVSEGLSKGGKAVAKTDAGWVTADEAGGGGGGGFDPSTMVLRRLQGLKAPADEVQDLVSKAKDLKKDGDTYSADLTEDGAKALSTGGFGRRGGPPPSAAKGSVKFWLKDGALVKYESKISGKRANQNGDETDFERTTTTEIKDVGTTKLTVPDEAKKKLS